MSTPTTSRGSSISQHLHATKQILQDVAHDTDVVNTTPDEAEVHALEQDAFEVLRLIRAWNNRLAPINRIPPEILTLVPGFLDTHNRDQGAIALTHVCRTWRKIFISCPSLWTSFDCEDPDKTHVYLERSRSLPIDLRLERAVDLSPHDPFLQVVPHAIARLKSIDIQGTPENLQDITAQLSHPAPLLESLAVEIDWESSPHDGPAIPATLFDGDLSSLRELRLKCIRTELPWRNMANLTSFTLGYTLLGNFPMKHLLDFFESAPHLRKIQLSSATPTSGAQSGRLVSLACLKRMDILGGGPPALLFDHLLIPVGAKLTTRMETSLFPPTLESSIVDGHLPRSLNNLKNLSIFTKIHLWAWEFDPRIRFSGPTGQVTMIPPAPRDTTTTAWRVLRSLERFDISMVEQLTITGCDLKTQDGCAIYSVFFRAKNLRTLTLSRCKNLPTGIHFLREFCPKLEELTLDPRVAGEKFDIQTVIGFAATRPNLKSVRIVSGDESVQTSALKLWEYVSHVECSPRVALTSDDSEDSDGGDSDDEED